MKLLLALSTVLLGTTVYAAPSNDFLGDCVMHIYVGESLFEDRIHVEKDKSGAYTGTLIVPDRFQAPIEHVSVKSNHLIFEITGNEGHGPFRVRYDGTFHAPDTFTGVGTLLDTGKLLGGFVGQKSIRK